MSTLILGFNSNPNIGLYGYCTDEYCLLGSDFPEKQAKDIEKALKVPVHRISIAGTAFIGVFLAGNSKHLLVPSIAFPEELKKLEELGIPYTVIDTKLTCLGNNMIISDKAVLASKEFKKTDIDQIKSAVHTPVTQVSFGEIYALGSLAAMNKKGILVSHDLEDEELSLLEETFNKEVMTGTVNYGNEFIKSGVLVNKNGLVIGNMSGGPELVNAEQAFHFTK